jgi:hypothetical protein
LPEREAAKTRAPCDMVHVCILFAENEKGLRIHVYSRLFACNSSMYTAVSMLFPWKFSANSSPFRYLMQRIAGKSRQKRRSGRKVVPHPGNR